ncbi:hypothetical protein RO3G_03844 [Rhizopus delemar RA 99-880]|uniref:Uncharacterized protein n=1 Tax=Rhizopus delemar (strain RA 99-880 / ATCC MYA-4621 / FGSC 9543 / NRRL 43880) TaxID=246409 RepID=I1BSF9_RHIO9|nr:hypothetical protein RO3G_03844 [Rhizopus delemar RA 99-880]|eukprot:EIE79139.1 hypothetical protein RO3G_03844 [Rhizopus delemar RA 99-880]
MAFLVLVFWKSLKLLMYISCWYSAFLGLCSWLYQQYSLASKFHPSNLKSMLVKSLL